MSRGLHSFSNSLFEGLKCGGKFALKNQLACTWRNFCVSKQIRIAYRWREIYVSDLHEVFIETRREGVDRSKTQPCELKTHPKITLGSILKYETVHSIIEKITGEKRGAPEGALVQGS